MLESITTPEATPDSILNGNLDILEANTVLLEEHQDELIKIGAIPDEFYPEDMQPIWDIKKLFVNGAGDIESLTRYYDLKCRNSGVSSTIRGQENSTGQIQMLAYEIGPERMGSLMADEQEDGPLHAAFAEDLDKKIFDKDVVTDELKLLQSMYGLETMTDLIKVKGSEFNQRINNAIKTPTALRWIKHNEAKYDEDKTYQENKQQDREWSAKILHGTTGMTLQESYEYVFSAAINYEPENIIDVVKKFEHFGVEKIQELTKVTGIHGLECYTVEQLERMVDFVNNPTKVAEELAQSDVIAVFTNRVGDHNGVLTKVANEVDDSSKRVLFFEMDHMSDIYRRFVTLSKAGVKPSTLILASHSGEGQFMVSDGREPSVKKRDIAAIASRKLVETVNNSDDNEVNPRGQKGYSINGLHGVARIVEDFMSPSRAIQDDEADEGHKKIIFNACHAGSEVPVLDLDESGERYSKGNESVISQLANDLMLSKVNSIVDIYGAASTLQMHKSDYGLKYSDAPLGLGLPREKLQAVKVTLKDSKVARSEVQEIVLRKH